VLLTAHDAFGYFGRAYGFEVIGVQGISTESEGGLTRIGTRSPVTCMTSMKTQTKRAWRSLVRRFVLLVV